MYYLQHVLNFGLFRALMACIKHLGQYPCPQCFVQKEQIQFMGLALDMQHSQNIQQDNPSLHDCISHAWQNVFEKCVALNSSTLEGILDTGSIVIMRVHFTHPWI